MNRKTNCAGQALAEMVLMLPVLLILAGIAMVVAYMCWQGVKVQEAANYAARIEGQERVAGGSNTNSINLTNGVGSGQSGDADITANPPSDDLSDGDIKGYQGHPDVLSVYGSYRDKVKKMFTTSEQNRLLVPLPKQGTDIDEIKVTRVMSSPSIFGVKIPQVIVTGTAYGGEDTNMYALPRWGCTGANATTCSAQNQYWSQSLHPESATSNPVQ